MTKKLIIIFVLLFGTINLLHAETLVQRRQDIQRFINKMVKQYHFNRSGLTNWFNKLNIQPPKKEKTHRVISRMSNQHAFLPWYQYRPIFLNKVRTDLGAAYWVKNKKWLDKANKIYGVPQSIIIATVGAESKYGAQLGSFPVFKSLTVLAFDYPRRHRFFTRELIAFLLYCKKNEIYPLSIRGSYAGAMGQPQFMPSNVERYGVDFDHSGKVDLTHDNADVIASVANFYKHNNWLTGHPVATRAVFNTKKAKAFALSHLNKKYPLNKLKSLGVYPKDSVSKNIKARVIMMQSKTHPEYWIVFHNFYVIKNYNNSTNYAMSIYQLSLLIKAIYHSYVQLKDQHLRTKKKLKLLKKNISIDVWP